MPISIHRYAIIAAMLTACATQPVDHTVTTNDGRCVYHVIGQDGIAPVLVVLDRDRSGPNCQDFMLGGK